MSVHSSLRRLSLLTRRVLAVSVLISGTVFAAPIGTPLSATLPVLSSPIGNPQPGESTIAVDALGNFTVAWFSHTKSDRQVYARSFDALGAPISAQFLVSPDNATNGFGTFAPVALSRSPEGRIVIAWIAAGTWPPYQFDTIRARAFAADGTPLGSQVDAGSTPQGGYSLLSSSIHQPAVAMIDNDEFVVAWVARRYQGSRSTGSLLGVTTEEVLARRFRVDGTALGEAITVDRRTFVGPDVSLLDPAIRIVRNPSGGYAIGYSFRVLIDKGVGETLPLSTPFRVRSYSADGRPTSLPLHLSVAAGPGSLVTQEEFGLSYIANGDLVLAWAVPNQFNDSTVETILTRRYSPLGIPRGKPVTVATRAPRRNSQVISLNVAPIPSGGYVVAWPDFGQTASFAQNYTADGSAIGPTFQVGNANDVSIATTVNGDLLSSYGGVFARKFQGP